MAAQLGQLRSKPLQNIRTAIRFRIDLRRKEPIDAPVRSPDKQSLAIFSFYSPFPDFCLLPDQKNDLKHGARTFIHDEQTAFTERSTQVLESVLESHQTGNLMPFLDKVCHSVTDECGWEAASIFLVDDQLHPSQLVLQAASWPSESTLPIGRTYALARGGIDRKS